MNERLRPLTNPYFLLALVILLTNDFYLKYEFHNWITGKLSDVAGLFVFACFWTVVMPSQKKTVYLLTALGFVFWKSTYSEPFINFFSKNVYSINRTIDVSDLFALLVLPASYRVTLEGWSKRKIVSIPIGLITIFSFCATSAPRPTQIFDSPEYVLFKTDFEYIEKYPTEFKVYQFDSMKVVAVTEIEIERIPPLSDDYHKSQVLGDLDLRVLRASKGKYERTELSSYKSQRDSLTIARKISITLDLDSVSDELHFQGTRLHGMYRRYSKEKHLLIDGRYKHGIHDSIWTFHNRDKNVTTRKYFIAGEPTKIERFYNGSLVTKDVSTRKDTITKQYLILAAISALVILIAIRLFLNFRASDKTVSMSTFGKVVQIILLPTIIFTMARILSNYISEYHPGLYELLAGFMLTNLFLIPIFAIIHYANRLRNRFDLILYILLFVSAIIWIEQYYYLKQIVI
jgi:hypothetical protein